MPRWEHNLLTETPAAPSHEARAAPCNFVPGKATAGFNSLKALHALALLKALTACVSSPEASRAQDDTVNVLCQLHCGNAARKAPAALILPNIRCDLEVAGCSAAAHEDSTTPCAGHIQRVCGQVHICCGQADAIEDVVVERVHVPPGAIQCKHGSTKGFGNVSQSCYLQRVNQE